MVAEVIINTTAKKLNKTFDYIIPKTMEEQIYIGSKVLVKFGNIKDLEEGYVVGIKEKSPYANKEISKIEDNISKEQIELAKWMSKKYFCNFSDTIKLMLAPGTTTKRKEKRIKEKQVIGIYLKKSKEEMIEKIDRGEIKTEKQKRIILFLIDNEGATVPEIELFEINARNTVNTLIKKGYLEKKEKKIERNPLAYKKVERTKKLELTIEQKEVYQKIEKTIENKQFKPFLIYGVTGSGKTEIYLQLIEKVLEKEKTAIVLVPEISLTPQMLNRFISRFGKEKIAVLHSKLSLGERYDEWEKIKNGEINIVIGARSAIFAPVKNLGIIIIDEEHDASYKSETIPKYNVKEVAYVLAKKSNAPLVLGSATPDMTTFYQATKGNIELCTLTKRANSSSLPKVKIIDLKEELANGNRSMLSLELYRAIEQNIKNKMQTILFLNRRGYSTFIMCRNCGYTAKCKNCNISLTYHRTQNRLKCHYCGYEEPVVTICPECNSDKIRYFGAGTQKLEQEIQKIFPNATTIRMDIDTVTKKNSHEEIINRFQKENIDILIGTQMVVKGHHFPKVTLVGVIAADSSLNIDDYRANERTFQILTQVAGRAGRENLEGNVIIQSYNPQNFSIQCARKQDYQTFYQTEIELRKELKYPPFYDIIVISFQGEKIEEIITLSNLVYNTINSKVKKEQKQQIVQVFKPMPAPIDKIQNNFRWRMILKTNKLNEVQEILNLSLNEIYQLPYKKTRVSIDINPYTML